MTCQFRVVASLVSQKREINCAREDGINMVLTKTDQKYIGEHSEQIMAEMKEYGSLTGKNWHPFNYDLGFANVEEWHKSLLKELKSLKTP